MPKKVFISCSFAKRNQFEEIDGAIKRTLPSINCEGYSFVFDRHLKFKSDKEMMSKALERIKESDVLIAELSDKQVGIGLEVGYAKALNKQIVYIKKCGSEYSTTVGGVADVFIEYESVDDLIEKIKTKMV